MSPRQPTLLLTMGDPAGIGPEILARVVSAPGLRRVARLAAVGDPDVLARAARRARVSVRFRLVEPEGFDAADRSKPGVPVIVSTQEAMGAFTPGEPSAATGRMAGRAIEVAAALADQGRADAIATAPISKQALRAAGYPYPGHTEFLGALTSAPETRMLFVGEPFRILLATIHLALRQVPDALDVASLTRTLEYAALAQRHFGWGERRVVAVLGLNPHAGEGGLLGEEEATVIGPAIEAARARGIRAEGPFPADTFFAQHAGRRDLGVVVAMYHDQGLIPAKSGGIGAAANVTLGLPFVRSSVDHGTAFDRAWRGGRRAPDAAGFDRAVRVGAALAQRVLGRRIDWTWR